jgi:hypothetical protein
MPPIKIVEPPEPPPPPWMPKPRRRVGAGILNRVRSPTLSMPVPGQHHERAAAKLWASGMREEVTNMAGPPAHSEVADPPPTLRVALRRPSGSPSRVAYAGPSQTALARITLVPSSQTTPAVMTHSPPSQTAPAVLTQAPPSLIALPLVEAPVAPYCPRERRAHPCR